MCKYATKKRIKIAAKRLFVRTVNSKMKMAFEASMQFSDFEDKQKWRNTELKNAPKELKNAPKELKSAPKELKNKKMKMT